MILRVDPWAPEYDGALQLVPDDDPDEAAEAVDPTVETTSWRPIVPEPVARPALSLVDGVRRVELRVLAGDAEPLRYGLFGSLAVGAVRLSERATLDEPVVQRALVMGGGILPGPVKVELAQATLCFAGHPVADSTPEAPLAGLQALMRQAEAELATGLGRQGIVIVDGPLTHLPPSADPIVGYIKRLRRAYLPVTHSPLLAQLPVGGRTPLFLIRDPGGRFDRYSWYVRLAPPGPVAHTLASVVRLEMSAAAGLEAARRAAGLTAQHLPGLASTADRDPRAPQNLVPVGALEQQLRHRLGDPRWIRRMLMQHLSEIAA
jgi:hypothetical protein